jgi:tripartite-type tricarboxylate transporter receptor subunit TctC
MRLFGGGHVAPVLLAAVLSAALAGPAAGQSVEEFYKGKSLPVIIGFSVGSAYDLYARHLARYMGRYIPGNPTLVPQNMPGAGSQRAAQYIYSVAPKDGSVFGTFSRSMPIEPLLGDAKFDGRQFTWVGNIANNNSLCAMWHTVGIKTWEDVITKPYVLGGQGPGSDLDLFGTLMKNVFGAKVKLVTGYQGGGDVNLAMERREIDGRCGWSWDSIRSTRPDWIRDKKIDLLVVFALEKSPEIPAEVPLALDKVESEEMRQVLRVHLAGQAFGRPFAAPPGIPPDRKAALRTAFDATMKDPEFIAEAKKAGLEVSPITGAEIDRLLAGIYALPPALIEKAKQVMKN